MKDESAEPILEPELPIIDPHHHLWLAPDAVRAAMNPALNPYHHVRKRLPRYLLDELLADLRSGHNIRATMFVECHSMYRTAGPHGFRSLGEVEFANGIAAMAASGISGDIAVCAGIIGQADLMLGDAVEPVLQAHKQAAGERYRGIRYLTQFDADPIFKPIGGAPEHLLKDPGFRAGFKWLHKLGLTFDAFLYEPQLPDLIDLARAFPETSIILNHVGTPIGIGNYTGTLEARFPIWRKSIITLADCPNVTVKLGGLGMPISGFKSFLASPPATSEELAAEWRPYIDTCIEAFGTERCMFESNFPTESGTCTYRTLWNTFKRLAAGASRDEKRALFSGVAARVYGLKVS